MGASCHNTVSDTILTINHNERYNSTNNKWIAKSDKTNLIHNYLLTIDETEKSPSF